MDRLYPIMIVSCVIASLTMYSHMQSSNFLDRYARVGFACTFCFIGIGALTELCGDWMSVSGFSPGLHRVVKCLEFCVAPALPVALAFGCGVQRYRKRTFVVLALHALIEIALLPTGKIISIDETSMYTRGPWYFIYVTVYVAAFVFLLCVFVSLSIRFHERDKRTLMLILPTLLVPLIPSLISSAYRTTFLGITLAAMAMYSYFEGLARQELDEANMESIERIHSMQDQTISGIAELIENRDANTGTHIRNTVYFVARLARAAQERGVYDGALDDRLVELVVRAAPLHDVGKIVVPDAILRKPARLTPEETAIMQTHAAEGGRIVLRILDGVTDEAYTKVAYDMACYHHEWWDGTGYPEGLAGEDIPLSARIMALADVFDALVMKRVYKEAYPVDVALRIIEDETGTHFDPVLAPIFVEIMRNEQLG